MRKIAGPVKSARADYLQRIDAVFSTHPRLKTEDTVWLTRREIEDRLIDEVQAGSSHICIDGPSGSGKTSLVTAQLSAAERQFIYVPVSQGMSWESLCRSMVAVPNGTRKSVGLSSLEVKLGLKGPIPIVEIKGGAEVKEIDPSGLDPFRLAEMVSRQDTVVVVDDAEKASKELLSCIADFSKALSNIRGEQCVVVGTGDIFRRLINEDISLAGRVAQISVGSLNGQSDSWWIFVNGFEKIGFENPASRLKRQSSERLKSEHDASRDLVYLAANGLPKLINELGRNICRSALGARTDGSVRTNITKHDIETCAQELIRGYAVHYRKRVPEVLKEIKKNLEVRIVLNEIFKRGVNKIHYWDEIMESCLKDINEHSFGKAVDDIMDMNLFVSTGLSGEVVFSEDPVFVHMLGVVAADPQSYGYPADFRIQGQLRLPL